MNVDNAVRELYAEMMLMLNQEDMDYRIEFQGNVFDFNKPLDMIEKANSDDQKHQVTTIFLDDALDKLVALLGNSNPEEDYELRHTWINIANLQRSTEKCDTVSEIVSQEYDVVDESTSKELDYNSIYIQAQRKDLSDDDKWNLLLNFITVQDGQKKASRTDSDTESRNAGSGCDTITCSSICGD